MWLWSLSTEVQLWLFQIGRITSLSVAFDCFCNYVSGNRNILISKHIVILVNIKCLMTATS